MKSPVLFIVFNRPAVTQRVFDQIRLARPSRLYIAADGARLEIPREKNLCIEVRSIVKSIDWPCEVKFLFHEKNLGCKLAVSTAIEWFFDQEEQGIILEDDCFPELTFFRFCDELLDKYKYDYRVQKISGDNFHGVSNSIKSDYYFTKNCHIWGWASWRSRWKLWYDYEIKTYPYVLSNGCLEDIIPAKRELRYWKSVFDRTYRGETNAWDYQWFYAGWINSSYTIIPKRNLISNIGFGADATHTKSSSKISAMKTYSFNFPIKNHPIGVFRNKKLDDLDFRRRFEPGFSGKILRKIKIIFRIFANTVSGRMIAGG